MEGPSADSEEKHEPVSDINTVVVDSLKALDPERPIREATDMAPRPNVSISAEGDTTEKQRPLVCKLRWPGCDARAANFKE